MRCLLSNCHLFGNCWHLIQLSTSQIIIVNNYELGILSYFRKFLSCIPLSSNVPYIFVLVRSLSKAKISNNNSLPHKGNDSMQHYCYLYLWNHYFKISLLNACKTFLYDVSLKSSFTIIPSSISLQGVFSFALLKSISILLLHMLKYCLEHEPRFGVHSLIFSTSTNKQEVFFLY